MAEPLRRSSGGDGDDQEWWKKFESDKKEKSYENKNDEFPHYDTPAQLFSLKNQNAVFIKSNPKQKLLYHGRFKNELRNLIQEYNIKFTGGDRFLENATGSIQQIMKSPIGRLALARDTLMAFLFNIYQTDQAEWGYLRVSGFLSLMINVANGETCNNDLAKKLFECLGT